MIYCGRHVASQPADQQWWHRFSYSTWEIPTGTLLELRAISGRYSPAQQLSGRAVQCGFATTFLIRIEDCKMTKLLYMLAVGLGVAVIHAAAPKPKSVRQINLSAIIHEPEGLMPSSHSVQALSFSPDEKWLAVGVGLHYKPGTWQPMEFASHLIIMPLQEGTGRTLQIDPDRLDHSARIDLGSQLRSCGRQRRVGSQVVHRSGW